MWYRDGIVYQIFPDRFARGRDWRQRAAASLDTPRKGPARALVEDWSTPPTYKRTDDGRIAEWDFYGGTLEGIVEHLDYLESLGVTVLYLNPIFEAASNHRYDTADYLAIDPMLGDEHEFRRLCAECGRHLDHSRRRLQPCRLRLSLLQQVWQLPRAGRGAGE